jgi:outer membrane protein TolC
LKIKSLWFPNVDVSGYILDKKKQDHDMKISMTYPIFTGGVRCRNIKIASNELKIAHEKLKQTTNLLNQQAATHYNDLIDLHEKIDVDKKYLDAVGSQVELLSKKYINGSASYYDWYLLENEYIYYQIKLLEDKGAVSLKEAEWYRFIGEKN